MVERLKNNNLIKDKINIDDYTFLDEIDHLKDNVCFLTLGGSYAYGTQVETSDVDIRGVSWSPKNEILLMQDHEQTVNEATDTVIYTINKIIDLFTSCNPNTIEMLGNIDRNSIYVHPKFKEFILDNVNLFLSKNAFNTFAGYANAQLNRLNNKLGRSIGRIEQQNILRSIQNASGHLYDRYGVDVSTIFNIRENKDGLYILPTDGNDNFNLVFNNVTKEMAQCFLNELASIFKDYNKLGKRNKNAIEHNKLNKHLMHLFRLTMMGYDILVKGEVNTYRQEEHDFLMSVRNNENDMWFDENYILTDKANDYIVKQMAILEQAKDESKLPAHPDKAKIDELKKSINNWIVSN